MNLFVGKVSWVWPVSGDIPAATAEDVDIAVEAARRAFSKPDSWASTSGSFRAKFLRAIADKVFDFLSFYKMFFSICHSWVFYSSLMTAFSIEHIDKNGDGGLDHG